MEEEAALRAVSSSVQALGRGFDANCDNRLLYCKGPRLVEVYVEHSRDLAVGDGLVVPRDVRLCRESGGRESFGPCSFHEMAEYFNKKSLLSGSIPLGSFNSAFSFTGSRKIDISGTKSLAMVGKFLPLCKVQLARNPSSLIEDVRRAVPLSWEPLSLARFIECYGTHVIISITIGGKDVVYVKQHISSSLSNCEIKNYIEDIGDQRFFEMGNVTSSRPLKFIDKTVDPFTFNNSQGIYPQPHNAPYLSAKEDMTLIFRRRGGDDLVQNHMDWSKSVPFAPDVIEMTFFPITSLLENIPGRDHLTRAINLYLEYKPPVEELRYFLEFQVPRIWAPVQDNLPGLQRKEPVYPSLQFSLMGQKLFISQDQISVGRKPVTGVRLCLEGSKQNRLCIHIQHLATLPKILLPYWDAHVAIGAPKWQGPEEQDSRWFEPVKWKNFSHVCTAPIENNETLVSDPSGVYVVTGAQLGVWDFGSKNVLYMKLLYSKVPGCTTRRSLWDTSGTVGSTGGKLKRLPSGDSLTSGDMSSGSGDEGKLTKFVDTSEKVKGPDNIPGHWLVTGAKLAVEKGKIVLRLKHSLLNY